MKPFKHHKSKNPWFRQVVPADLRGVVGKSEIRLSLGNVSHAEATAKITALSAKWAAEFARLRNERIVDSGKLAIEYSEAFFESLRAKGVEYADRAVLIMLRVISDAIVSSWGRRSLAENDAQEIVGYAIGDDHPENDELSELELIPEADRAMLIGRLRIASKDSELFGSAFREVIAYALAKERWDWFAFPVAMTEDAAKVTIHPNGAMFALVAREMGTRLIDYRSPRWNEKLLRSMGYLGSLNEIATPQLDNAGTQSANPTVATHSISSATVMDKHLSEAFALWEKMATPGESAKVEARRCQLRFTDLYGDLLLSSITPNVVRDYRNNLLDIPKGIDVKKLLSSGEKLADVIADALKKEAVDQKKQGLSPTDKIYERLHATSVKKEVGILSAVFGIAIGEGWMSTNPAQNIKIPGFTKSRRGQSVRRKPFTKNQIATLFASAVFTGCGGSSGAKRHDPGLMIVQDPMYWVFLFGATNGCRLEEIGQVNLADIGTGLDDHKNPFTFIQITDEGEGQTVKSDDSIRCIIVHPQLIRLGFNDYVARRRALGATTLFDLERKGKRKMMTGALSQKVNRYIDRHVTTDKRYVWYSTRHAFSDRALKIPREIARQMIGHSHGGLYGSGLPAEELASVFGDLDVSFIDWDVMVRAVERAKRENLLL
ncbi:DUF6538 domain-containing protein [Sphingorhabdus sp.]|jgi:hypothetical protein|uniref:DUF6538 domain-containing protein n=1 Tax=Sphingorhabdus sp. TaxID=1902408 RepID=UPI003D814B85